MVRDRAGRAARHRVLERPQASVCLGSQAAASRATSLRYCRNTKCRTHLADAPLSLAKEEYEPSPNGVLQYIDMYIRNDSEHDLATAMSSFYLTTNGGVI